MHDITASDAGLARPPSLIEFVAVIVRIGLTSFGGGVSGWLMRVMVQDRRWISEADFMTGLSLSQVFPGINVLNMTIWMGYRLHGWRGALAGGCAMIIPPGLVLIGLATAFADLSRYPSVRTALDGVAAAAIGLGGSMGVRAARRAAVGVVPIAVMTAAFVSIGVLRWPLVPVMLVLAPASIALAAWEAGRDAR